jgi:hypothetical protein
MTTGPSSVRYKLWHAQRPDVAANSGAPQSFGKVRKSANLRADCGYLLRRQVIYKSFYYQ